MMASPPNAPLPKSIVWGVLFALLAAACGGQTEEDADAGGAGGATSDGAGGAGGAAPTPSDDWLEIVGGGGLFCIRSRAGRVLCGSSGLDEYLLSYYQVDGLVDGISLGNQGATWARGEVQFLGAWVDGYPGTEWLVPPPGPTFGVAMFLGRGYCSLPEPPPAVPECFGLDGSSAFPPGRKFRKVAGDWVKPGERASTGEHRLIGITEEGMLWCNYLGGDGCHAGFGLDPNEQPVSFDISTTVVITDWGRAFRHSQPAFDETAEPDSELLRPAPAPDAFLVAALSQGMGFLDRDGRLLFLLDSKQNSTFYRTDTEEVEELSTLRFRGVVGGNASFCGILDSGFVNCWTTNFNNLEQYAPEEALPPP